MKPKKKNPVALNAYIIVSTVDAAQVVILHALVVVIERCCPLAYLVKSTGARIVLLITCRVKPTD